MRLSVFVLLVLVALLAAPVSSATIRDWKLLKNGLQTAPFPSAPSSPSAPSAAPASPSPSPSPAAFNPIRIQDGKNPTSPSIVPIPLSSSRPLKDAPSPTFPSRYFLEATFALPYASIVEPVTFYFDGAGLQQRIEYYSGTDVYVSQAQVQGGLLWQINPVANAKFESSNQCFYTGNQGTDMLMPFLPDASRFTLQQQQVMVNGLPCWHWQLVDPEGVNGDVINTYDYYISDTDPQVPVLYNMMGYDTLIGSHYDHYIVTYTLYQGDYFDPTKFVMPSPAVMPCVNSSGAFGNGDYYTNPTSHYRMIFPSSSSKFDPSSLSPDYARHLTKYGHSLSRATPQRQRIFHQNNMLINAHNRRFARQERTFSMRLNHLADWTEQEMKQIRGKQRSTPESEERRKAAATAIHEIGADPIPTAIDWRDLGAVTPVQDQATCGSCWSFGSTGSITGTVFLRGGGQGGLLVDFSSQQLMDCSWAFGNNACDGGEDFQAYNYTMHAGGLYSLADYGPYLAQDMTCRVPQYPITKVQLSGWVTTDGSTEGLLNAIATKGPISVSINAAAVDRSFSFYHSGVYSNQDNNQNYPCPGELSDLDHSVLAVGYGVDSATGLQYYTIKNSWSTHWGNNGYINIATQYNTCGVKDVPTYVLLAGEKPNQKK